MAGLDDNVFKQDLPQPNQGSLRSAERVDSKKRSGQEETVRIITEKCGQKFDEEKKWNYLVDYEKSALDAKIYRQCAPATVEIVGWAEDKPDDQGWKPATGSGAIIDPRGLVVTNAHVVEAMKTPYAHLSDGRVCKLECLILDPLHDLALLRIVGEEQEGSYPYLKLARSQPRAHSRVWGIGHPLGVPEICIAPGRIAWKKSWETSDWEISLRQHGEHGDSGCPEVNAKGEMVGVYDAGVTVKVVEVDENNNTVKIWNPRKWCASDAETNPKHSLQYIHDEKQSSAIRIEYVRALLNQLKQNQSFSKVALPDLSQKCD